MPRLGRFASRARARVATACRLPAFVLAWLVPCWCLLGAFRLLLITVPFRRLQPWLGAPGGDAPWVPLASDRQSARALMLGRTVRLAARFTPWESACLAQALAAAWLLRAHRIPYGLYLGWRRGTVPAGLTPAHAWVAVGRVRVTGGDGFDDHAVLATYVPRGLPT